MRKLCVLAWAFLAISILPVARAEDAVELLRERDGSRSNTVNLNYRQIRFERVLADMEKLHPSLNVKVKAESFQEEQELLATPVTLGPLSGVSWDTAIKYIADRMGLIIDRSQVADGVMYLEKVARFTDTFDGVRLGEAVREIAKRGNANVIFSPLVGTDAPVFLSFTDVPWREALESVLKAHSCTVLYDADGKIMRISTTAEADIQFEFRSRPLRYVQPEGSHFQPEIVKSDHNSFVGRKGAAATDVGKSLITVLEQVKSDKGNVTYESRTNTLIIRDTPIKIQEMLKLVDEIDVAPSQVLIETRLVQVDENPSSHLGVRWGTDDGNGIYQGVSGGVESGPSWTTSWPWSGSGNWGNLGVLGPSYWSGNGAASGVDIDEANAPVYTMGTMSLSNLTFLLQAAKYDDHISVTQAPQILVLDNEEASVFIGSVRNYALVESTISDGETSYSYRERELLVGVQLLVVPHVCRGTDQVIIEIVPKQTDNPIISEVSAGGASSITIPTSMSVKTVHTKMMLHSTETGVIAGLFRNEMETEERRIPGLSNIPIIGRLFKHNSKTEIKQNSMIFVTPTIVPPSHTEEFDRDVEDIRESLASSLY
ncbi:MAG: hypothetical protein LIP77_04815 [Planctomycetes bacterium]|nr:hypothetical protein [Planctomycetota bacterium]